MELTMIVEEGENGYFVGQLVEYPAALSQGKTIEELESNLKDALELLLQVQDNIQPTSELQRQFIFVSPGIASFSGGQ